MADLVFTIRTPAELQGAEAAARAMEINIGKAKALGKEHAELEQRLSAVKQSIDAYKAANADSAQATQKATDDSQRYAEALEKLAHAAHEAKAAEAQRQIELRNTVKASQQAADESDRYAAALEKMDRAAHESRAEEAQRQIDLRNTAKSTADVGNESDKAGEKVSLFARHNKELKKVAQELSRDFPVMGLAIKALANPIAATLTVATTFFVVMKRQIDETNRKLDEMAAVNARALSNFAENFRNAQNEAIAANQEFIAGLDDIARAAGNVDENANAAVAAIRRWTTANLEFNNAAQAKAIAEVNLAEEQKKITPAQAIAQRQQIRDFYEQKANEARTAGESAEVARREQQLRELQDQRGRIATAPADGLDETQRQARIKTLQEQAKNTAELAAELRKGLPSLQEKIDTLTDTISNLQAVVPSDPGAAVARENSIAAANARRDALIAEQDDLQRRTNQADTLVKRYERRAAEFEGESRAIAAGKERAATLDQQIEDLTRELADLKETIRLNQTLRTDTNALNRDTRSLDSERERIKAEEEERRKAEQEAKRRGRETDESIRGEARDIVKPLSGGPESKTVVNTDPLRAEIQAAGNSVVQAILELRTEMVAQLHQAAAAARDSRDLVSKISDSQNT